MQRLNDSEGVKQTKLLVKKNYYLTGWLIIVAIGEIQFGYMMGELTLIQTSLP